MTRKSVSISRGPLYVTAPTKREALSLMDKAIDAALSGDYTAEIVTVRYTLSVSALLWREPNGWRYRMTDSHCVVVLGDDKDEALRRCRFHLAQNIWTPSITLDKAFLESCELDATSRAELSNWISWQRSYRHLHVVCGLSESEARAQAASNWILN